MKYKILLIENNTLDASHFLEICRDIGVKEIQIVRNYSEFLSIKNFELIDIIVCGKDSLNNKTIKTFNRIILNNKIPLFWIH